ncbi:MAG: hypothetical protein OK455_10545 [Thaumarchaeota archaeon]|nr:hypothetical protein [Nitrososphaerota archaeon]
MNEFRFERKPMMLDLFQDLNDYATTPMMDLVKGALDEDGVAAGWRDELFIGREQYISFEVMALKNRRGLQKIRDYLWDKMKRYERTDPVRFRKSKTLHDRAERALTA